MSPPWSHAPRHSPDALLERARQAAAGSAAQRLDGLVCCDAARWLTWPGECPAATAVETELLERGPASAPNAALTASVAARTAIAVARPEDFTALAAQLEALPAGYPVKSLWLHWRDLLIATGRYDRWDDARRRLRQRVQRDGLPPSETIPALLGRLNLRRWRAETRLQASARAAFEERLDGLLARAPNDATRWVHTAAAGSLLVMLGDPDRGAALVHQAADEAPVAGVPQPTRLFSRPAPEAAIWLRRAVERASIVDHSARDGLLQHTLLALLHLAGALHARHVLREALDPLPVRFQRPDVTALVLVHGAHAWLSCGEQWTGHEWLIAGLRTVGRFPNSPLATATIEQTARWIERTRDTLGFDGLRDLLGRLDGVIQLRAEAELAGLTRLLGTEHQAWDRLGHAYRLAQSLNVDEQAAVVVTVADVLLGWDHHASGFELLRRAIDAEATPKQGRLPSNLASGERDAAEELASLTAVLRDHPLRLDAATRAIKVLLRREQTELAGEALQAALETSDALVDAMRRSRAELAIARQVAEGYNSVLAGNVARVTADEATAVMERLRIDDPPVPPDRAGA